MTSISPRKEFLEIIGKAYHDYGYPEYCGWIEGLLLLELKEWSQKGISEQLGELFSKSTSVPSVNRALKLLESFGIVEKTGSRKIGYHYRLQPSSNLAFLMFQQLLAVNQAFIANLQSLETKTHKGDSELNKAIKTELAMAELWNHAIEKVLESMRNKHGD